MSKKIVIIVVIAIVVCAGGFYAWDAHLSPKAKALAIVKRSLNDPYSAVFEQVKYVGKTGATCGHVNAKNRMGAFTGQTLFVVEKNGELTFKPTESIAVGSPGDKISAMDKQIAFLNKLILCSEDKK